MTLSNRPVDEQRGCPDHIPARPRCRADTCTGYHPPTQTNRSFGASCPRAGRPPANESSSRPKRSSTASPTRPQTHIPAADDAIRRIIAGKFAQIRRGHARHPHHPAQHHRTPRRHRHGRPTTGRPGGNPSRRRSLDLGACRSSPRGGGLMGASQHSRLDTAHSVLPKKGGAPGTRRWTTAGR